jgi:hypothetical protein
LGDIARLYGLLREHIVDFSESISGLHQDTVDFYSGGQFNVHISVSDHIGTGHIDIKDLKGLMEQSGFRFSAITLHAVFRQNACRVMGTVKDGINDRAFVV